MKKIFFLIIVLIFCSCGISDSQKRQALLKTRAKSGCDILKIISQEGPYLFIEGCGQRWLIYCSEGFDIHECGKPMKAQTKK